MSQKIPKWIFYFLVIKKKWRKMWVCEEPISYKIVLPDNYRESDYKKGQKIRVIRGYSKSMGLRTTWHKVFKSKMVTDKNGVLGLIVFVGPALD